MKRVILPDIRSNYNVGAIFRSCDGAGVEKVYLVGHTPTPIDRFGRVVGEISKTALGAEQAVLWEKINDVVGLISKLKAEGFTVVAVEQADKSVLLHDFKVPEKVVYIFGSETAGLSEEILDEADVILELPMLGQKESLNVSVTAGIVLYHR
ncbi:MAG: TrmH family RNA methyltransferase [Candidatus Paceibacterota bacterium]